MHASRPGGKAECDGLANSRQRGSLSGILARLEGSPPGIGGGGIIAAVEEKRGPGRPPTHGHDAAVKRHQAAGELLCEICAEFVRTRQEERAAKRKAKLDATGARLAEKERAKAERRAARAAETQRRRAARKTQEHEIRIAHKFVRSDHGDGKCIPVACATAGARYLEEMLAVLTREERYTITQRVQLRRRTNGDTRPMPDLTVVQSRHGTDDRDRAAAGAA